MLSKKRTRLLWLVLAITALAAFLSVCSPAFASGGRVIPLWAEGDDIQIAVNPFPDPPYHTCVLYDPINGEGFVCDAEGILWVDFGDEVGQAHGVGGMHSWDHGPVFLDGKSKALESPYVEDYVDGYSIGYGTLEFENGGSIIYHVKNGWAKYEPDGTLSIRSVWEIVGGMGVYEGATGKLYVTNSIPIPDSQIHGWVKLAK